MRSTYASNQIQNQVVNSEEKDEYSGTVAPLRRQTQFSNNNIIQEGNLLEINLEKQHDNRQGNAWHKEEVDQLIGWALMIKVIVCELIRYGKDPLDNIALGCGFSGGHFLL